MNFFRFCPANLLFPSKKSSNNAGFVFGEKKASSFLPAYLWTSGIANFLNMRLSFKWLRIEIRSQSQIITEIGGLSAFKLSDNCVNILNDALWTI